MAKNAANWRELKSMILRKVGGNKSNFFFEGCFWHENGSKKPINKVLFKAITRIMIFYNTASSAME